MKQLKQPRIWFASGICAALLIAACATVTVAQTGTGGVTIEAGGVKIDTGGVVVDKGGAGAGSVVVAGNDQKSTVNANGKKVEISGNDNTVTVNGKSQQMSVSGNDSTVRIKDSCTHLYVNGNSNTVYVNTVQKVTVSGNDNKVYWRNAYLSRGVLKYFSPKVDNTGNDNTVSRTKK